MALVDIDKGLVQKVIDGNYGLDIAHENLDFEPSDNKYLELNIYSNEVRALSINDSNQVNGIFRIKINYPSGTGAIACKTKADEILSDFSIGERIVYNNQVVTIRSFDRKNAVNDDGWYSIVITLYFIAVLTR